jgi:hypothetical protein
MPWQLGPRAFVIAAIGLHAAVSSAQEAGGSIRGRVTAGGGAPVVNVRVVAQSPSLTSHRETVTSGEGDYAFAFLPAGEYVVTFERDGMVTVKRTTRLSALETVLADAVMVAGKVPDEAIVVVIDPDGFPHAPVFSENFPRATLERLPLSGGWPSALTLPAGTLSTGVDDALITWDGAPVRFTGHAAGRPLLDPGAAALQEATFVTAGVPAEAGRFQSGLIAVVTPSGGEHLAGAFGVTLTNSDMQADMVDRAQATDGTAVNGHYQIGGTLDGRRTWLFAAGRHLGETVTHHARLSDAVFSSPTRERLWEAKVTHAVNEDHRLQGLFVTGGRDTRQAPPVGAMSVEDASALEDRTHTHRLGSVSYTGVPGRRLELSARMTAERWSSAAEGPARADGLTRTAVRDQQTGALIWGPGSCATCDPEERTSTTWRAQAGYLVSTASDAHHITAGYEGLFGRLDPASVPSGGSFELRASRFVAQDGRISPVLEPNGSAAIVWHPAQDNRLTHRANAFFVSDEWRRGSNLVIQAGLRWDGQHLSRRDAAERLLSERGFSPRVSVSWSPSQGSGWVLTSGYARYTADLLHRISPVFTGQAERRFRYQGPPVNTSAAVVDTGTVVAGALNWLAASGGTARAPSFASEPGLTVVDADAGDSPHVSEWSIGASQLKLGAARIQADLTWKRAALREWRVDPTRKTTDASGLAIDQVIAAASRDLLSRNSAALALQLHYRLGIQASLAARYTLSRSWGATDVSAGQDDPSRIMALAYPEYVEADWAAPSGDLSDDRRHRLKLWGQADVLVSETLGIIGVDLLQTLESGRPYGLVSWIDVSPFVANPGYAQPPTAVPYYVTARDAFRTPSANRTDLAVRYSRRVPGSIRSELLVQFHFLNLFDKRRVLDPEAFDVVRTAFTEPARFAPFNPFVQSPERGVHWDVDPRLSSSLENAPMTLPRAYRLSVGLRF